MRLLVGSQAIKRRLPSFPRTPKDSDYFCSKESEVFGTEDFYHPRLTGWLEREYVGDACATPEIIYTIKLSHSAWDLRNGSWFKHMGDLAWLKGQNFGRVNEELYELLYGIWEERYGAKKVNLDMDYEAFFDDAVPRQYDHDSIHESVALFGRPLYEAYLDGDIKMDMEKVWADTPSPYRQRLLFLEEVLATALERYVIPSGYTASPKWAYVQALKKTITSLTKGRSSRFMAENYYWYRSAGFAFSDNYVRRHRDNAHLLRPFKERMS